ncbi:MAG: helix-turn-helix transcriptional regulator [Gammaproteobacteria bacterium]
MFNIQPKEYYLILIFLLLLLASGIDMMMDFSAGTDFNHIAQESVVFALSFIALGWLVFDVRRQTVEIGTLRAELVAARKPQHKPEKYVLDAKTNLSKVISHQFDDWQLTTSEKDVGWLLLKGLSLKEIAAIRKTLEKTVRQQASSVYKKAGLSGRHAFAAWFIEDAL